MFFQEPFVGSEGINKLAGTVTGAENVFLGVRPFGFHAGNMTSMLAYPLLLCEAVQAKGITPSFKFHVFLNDYEQNGVRGHDLAPNVVNDGNVYPADTTLQYARHSEGNCSVTDYWAPVIKANLDQIAQIHPGTTIQYIRSSEIKPHPTFRDVVYETFKRAEDIANIAEEATGLRVHRPADYCRPITPCCHTPTREFQITDNLSFDIQCSPCDYQGVHSYEELDFWLNHKPLALPRISIFGIDLCITGIDHLYAGDFKARPKLLKMMGVPHHPFHTLYAPLLLREDGMKMSKTDGNSGYLALPDLLSILRNTHGKDVVVPDRVLRKEMQLPLGMPGGVR